MKLTIKFRYEILGGHAHIAVFSGKSGFTLGKCGDLIMTVDEFRAFRLNMASLAFEEENDQRTA